ncbi:unnamed protein product [Chrysodeixis includens]|uniref:Transcription factor Adf-1 n=1 Tax=Chrysodeixis includens TaxID=689277 RepID=A0A9P0C3D2_CHRIL|nr:unnamed protein product [Chrysodeixis includens]
MKDNQHLMIELVKIVERYPELYDLNLDSYRTRFSEEAWAKVAASVQAELNEECTVDEVKVKWKGIRSSFNRYKAKLHQNNNDSGGFKKYYLYDHLRFLEPFVRPKASPSRDQDKSCNFLYVDNSDANTHSDSIDEWNPIEIKPDLSNNFDKHETDTSEPPKKTNNEQSHQENSKKRKLMENKDAEEESEDLQFFRSILPDIRSFTIKEKRKLKMGILKLIDDIENERTDES